MVAYLNPGEFDRAIVDYNAALELNPGHIAALYGRGIARLRKGGMVAAANKDINAAKEADPGIVAKFSTYGVR